MEQYKNKAVLYRFIFLPVNGGIFWENYHFMEIDLRGLLQNFHEIKNRKFSRNKKSKIFTK